MQRAHHVAAAISRVRRVFDVEPPSLPASPLAVYGDRVTWQHDADVAYGDQRHHERCVHAAGTRSSRWLARALPPATLLTCLHDAALARRRQLQVRRRFCSMDAGPRHAPRARLRLPHGQSHPPCGKRPGFCGASAKSRAYTTKPSDAPTRPKLKDSDRGSGTWKKFCPLGGAPLFAPKHDFAKKCRASQGTIHGHSGAT